MSEYNVRLILEITADTPEDAVETFVEALVSRGLRDWKYKVVDETGDELLIWGNTLEEVTEAELLADIQEAGNPIDPPLTAEEIMAVDNELDAAMEVAETLAREDMGQEAKNDAEQGFYETDEDPQKLAQAYNDVKDVERPPAQE